MPRRTSGRADRAGSATIDLHPLLFLHRDEPFALSRVVAVVHPDPPGGRVPPPLARRRVRRLDPAHHPDRRGDRLGGVRLARARRPTCGPTGTAPSSTRHGRAARSRSTCSGGSTARCRAARVSRTCRARRIAQRVLRLTYALPDLWLGNLIAEGALVLLPRLPPLPRLHAPARAHRQAGRRGGRRRSPARAARRVRLAVLGQALVAVGHGQRGEGRHVSAVLRCALGERA